MYKVDKDRVVELDTAPRPDIGAPIPVLVADEGTVLLAYITSEPDPSWDGTWAKVVSPDSADEPIAIVRFSRVCAHMLGRPNDEAFEGHPLASRGLRPYAVSEIADSSWIHALERMNAVHPFHRPEHFARYKHFIFAFHDSTFECVAESFTVERCRGSIRSALQRMVEMLNDERV